MYPYAEDILKDILTGVVEESTRDKCSTQVLSDKIAVDFLSKKVQYHQSWTWQPCFFQDLINYKILNKLKVWWVINVHL